jgi:hypothetical protein
MQIRMTKHVLQRAKQRFGIDNFNYLKKLTIRAIQCGDIQTGYTRDVSVVSYNNISYIIGDLYHRNNLITVHRSD